MPHPQARGMRTLLFMRLFTGAAFMIVGWSKISSFEFARITFPASVSEAINGRAPQWYGELLQAWVTPNPGKVAVLVGLLQLAVGVGLLLGLAVRPMCTLGVFYVANVMFATWNTPGIEQPFWRWLQFQMPQILTLFVLILLGVAHAGEHWGLGALYHRRRIRWEAQQATRRWASQRPEVKYPGPSAP